VLTYDLQHRGDAPLYVHLYQCIKGDLEAGRIKAGAKLPSKRSLAEHLKISVITVQNAYEQLAAEGYIFSKEKSGYYAATLETPSPVTEQPPRREAALSVPPPYLIDFHANNLGMEHFPFSVWARQLREILSEMGGELLRRMPSAGVLKLREVIADFLYHFRGMDVAPEQIVIGAGTEYLYGLLIKLLGRDRLYALEDPGFPKIGSIYRNEGANCRYIGLDESGINMSELRESCADIVHVSPAHHFPTGLVMPVKRRLELLAWAAAGDRYIIEDEYDSEFRFSGKIIPTLFSAGSNNRVIYINTFSKTIAPSIRISYLVLPPQLSAEYERRMGFYSCTVSSFEQYTLAKFIEGGYFERHLNRMRKLYRSKRDYLIAAIRTISILNEARILGQESGLHFLLELSGRRSDEELVALAGDLGIKVSCLSQYCHDPAHVRPAVLVINYSGVETEQIDRAVAVLSWLGETAEAERQGRQK
jgi:GntR family transcriptional regulator / MocR family aminotransferase